MAKSELKELLLQEEQELAKSITAAQEKLAAVRRLLGKSPKLDSAPAQAAPEPKKVKMVRTKSPRMKPEGKPRGNQTWEEYVVTVLKEIGGKGKTQDVIDYATKANPGTPKDTIRNAVAGKLSKLYRKNKLGANKGGVKSEGYEFFVLPQPNLFGNAASA